MGRLTLYILVVILGFASVLVYGSWTEATSRRFLLTMDIFGISDTARLEKQRIESIMNLTVTYERKQALIGGKVFLGATPDMVKLALGVPKAARVRPASVDEAELLIWQYYLPGQSKPTLLEFEQGVLVNARMSSALEKE